MKRLAIYVHYDKFGRVLDFEKFFINALLQDFAKVIVVSNGEIDKHAFDGIAAVEIVERQNRGFDFGAWKDVICSRYESEIGEYDQLLITNNSIYGPIGSFSGMIAEMDRRDCDFWGINRHPANDCCIIRNDPATLCREHLQSYWLVFKTRLLHSVDFIDYWRNLPELDSFKKAVGYGEVALTHHFEQKGYSSDCYADFSKYSAMTGLNPCFYSYEQITEDHVPVLKRKYFYEYFELCMMSGDLSFKPAELLDFMERNRLYDCSMIRQDLYATAGFRQLLCSLGDIVRLGPPSETDNQDSGAKGELYLIVKDRSGSFELSGFMELLNRFWNVTVVAGTDELKGKYRKFLPQTQQSDGGLAVLAVINELSGCSKSVLHSVEQDLSMMHHLFSGAEVSQLFAEDADLALLAPFPHIAGPVNHLAVFREPQVHPLVFCCGKKDVIESLCTGFLNGGILFEDQQFLENNDLIRRLLNRQGRCARYYCFNEHRQIAALYYQLENVHRAVTDPQILMKIERQIKRIRRNSLLGKLLWWKKDDYERKNRRHQAVIDELLRT